jgi:hypothetical protein
VNSNSQHNSPPKDIVAIVEALVLAVAVLVGMGIVCWVLWRCRVGIDFTDEGFCLIWISNPWLYEVSTTQCGFIYYPLYRLVGGDVALLRQVNILITLGLAWCLLPECKACRNAALSRRFKIEEKRRKIPLFMQRLARS